MAYIGKNLVGVLKEQKSVSTMTGDGSDTTLTLSDTPGSVNNVLVFFDGIRQQPITDYTLSGTTVTFTTAPEAGVIVTAVIGNHSGINPKAGSVTDSKIVDGSVIADNIDSVTNSQVSALSSSKLTGTLPAIDGSALTGLTTLRQVVKSASDPTVSTNPTDGVGEIWCNTTTGNMYVCTDATDNANHWINMGKGTGDIINYAPTNYTDTFPDLNQSSSTNYTFSGASDPDGTVTHYLVENISNPSKLAVSTAEVAKDSPHTFVTQAVGSNTDVTFVVKTKDNLGKYSSGTTVTVTILATIYTVANGGVESTVGDYKVHTFLGDGTFTVTQIGTDATIDYLVVAGGGGGGNSLGGGGGAGGLRNSFNNETSGGGGSSETAITGTVQAYQIDVGGGGAATSVGDDSKIIPASGSTITSDGGGDGGDYDNGSGNAGGSGGGGNGSGGGGNGTANQGYAGGLAPVGNSERSSGGGGAGAVGGQNQGNTSPAGAGGVGVQSNIDGNNYYWAGGGGGANYNHGGGNGGLGGGGGGSIRVTPGAAGTGGGSAKNSGETGTIAPGSNGGAGGVNTGGGGGGGVLGDPVGVGGQGGSGVVILRYKFQ